MSGFEIAGIVLALLPLVLRSVDAYRDDFRRLTVFFKPLKHVEKLSRALDLQNLLLKELIREITISSDCPDVELLDDDPQQYLKEREVCDQIKGFMGDNEYSLLVQELYSVYRSVKKVEEAISKLVSTCHKARPRPIVHTKAGTHEEFSRGYQWCHGRPNRAW